MRLTAFTDYSLRVLMYLAAEPARRATIAEIASAFDISENHLTKVVHFLGQHRWIVTVRGKGGGIHLRGDASSICVGQVVRATEGAAVPAECFDPEADRCAIVGACRLRGVLHEAVNAFYAALDGYTLADLVHNRAVLVRILRPASPARAGAAP